MSEPDEFHAHEALHTAHVLMDCYGDHVCDHPFVKAHPGLQIAAEQAMEAMMEVYQSIGRQARGDSGPSLDELQGILADTDN